MNKFSEKLFGGYMKVFVVIFFVLIQQAFAWREIRCNDGQVILQAVRKNQSYTEAKIRLLDPKLAAIAEAREIDGYAYEAYGTNSFDHALFYSKGPNASRKVTYLSINKASRGEFSIFRPGRTECLRYEENCSCCYYGDCERQCLEERQIPTVNYLEQIMSCEVI